jgi:hypothetical protein
LFLLFVIRVLVLLVLVVVVVVAVFAFHVVTLIVQKVVQTWCAFKILTSKYNGVHVFDIAASKSGPNPRCV